MPQAIHLFAKCFDVLEVPVHRGVTHVGHFIELVQFFHDDFADLPRRDFALAETAQLARDVPHGFFDGFAAHRAFLQRLVQSAAQLVLVERHAALIVLHHQRHHQLGGFERGETLAAGQALAAPANLRAFGRQPRVVYLGVVVRAEGTVHGLKRHGPGDGPAHGP